MKKCMTLLFALCFLLAGCAPGKAPEPSGSVTPAPPSSAVSSAVSEGWTVLASWEHTDWQQTEGLIFAWDLDGDGKTEEVRFAEGPTYTTRCTVGEEELSLNIEWLETAVLLDAKRADGAKELLLSGGTNESDQHVLHYRSRDGKLEEIEDLFGSLSCRDDALFLSWYVDALGTWGVRCPYTLDAEGKLSRASEVLTVDLDMFEQERELKLKRDLPAQADGKAVTVPAGSRLYPVRYALDLHWVDLRLANEDTVVRVELTFPDDEMSFGARIGGVDETEYFESLPYAG